MPLSCSAILAAAMPSCAKRSVRRTSLGFLKYKEGLKSGTSPAIRQSKVEGSNWVIVLIPLLPFTRFAQNVFRSLPIGETTPTPVTTTFRLLIVIRYAVSLPYEVKQQKSLTTRNGSRVSGPHADHLNLLKQLSL